jgi:hypothetical protein
MCISLSGNVFRTEGFADMDGTRAADGAGPDYAMPWYRRRRARAFRSYRNARLRWRSAVLAAYMTGAELIIDGGILAGSAASPEQ